MTAYILITGAAGGIGSAMAHELAGRGYDLFLTDRLEQVSQFGAEIARAYGVAVRSSVFDLALPEQRSQFLRGLEAQELHFCGLINVAGRDYEGAFTERPQEEVLNLTRLLIEANLDLTHALLNLREPSQRFLIINVCSLAAFFPMPYKAMYSSAKLFLLNFSRALREEIRAYGNVLALCPAGLPTTPEMKRKIATQGIWGRLTTTDTRSVVRGAVERALKGRAVYIPGITNRLLVWVASILPRVWVVKYISARWQRAQARLASSRG